jgi:endonuclease/exonuclease/phosphatase family metal-dependent hydrolase
MLLRVVTYNVHGWTGKNDRRDSRLAIEVIRTLQADVIALQEVSFATYGSHPSSPEALGLETGMRIIPGPTLFRKDTDYGNALLSRIPFRTFHRMDISVEGREPRGAIFAVLETDYGPVNVIATHLGLQLGERMRQIHVLLTGIKTLCHGDYPLLIMGDFNEWNPFSPVLRLLRSRFGKISFSPTYPSILPILALDLILVRPRKIQSEYLVFKTPLAKMASDHLPVRATVQIPPPPFI